MGEFDAEIWFMMLMVDKNIELFCEWMLLGLDPCFLIKQVIAGGPNYVCAIYDHMWL